VEGLCPCFTEAKPEKAEKQPEMPQNGVHGVNIPDRGQKGQGESPVKRGGQENNVVEPQLKLI